MGWCCCWFILESTLKQTYIVRWRKDRALSLSVCAAPAGAAPAPEARWLRWLTERKARAEAYEYRTMRPLGRPWTVEHVLLFI